MCDINSSISASNKRLFFSSGSITTDMLNHELRVDLSARLDSSSLWSPKKAMILDLAFLDYHGKGIVNT